MAYSQTIELVQGDMNPQLTMTLRDANSAAPGKVLDESNPETWAVIDLTGSTVRLKLRMLGQTVLKDTLQGVITDAAGGKVTFLFNANTLDTAGTIEGEIEITDSGNRPQTVVDLIRLKVREQF